MGAGYFHHSNGHTQLPNSGLNTALASFSTSFELNKKLINYDTVDNLTNNGTTNFYIIKTGYKQ